MRAAPLPGTDLAAVLAPFGESLGLPAAAYTSPEVLEWETTEFWQEGWIGVGRTADLLEAGQARAVPVGAQSVLITKDHDGTVAAFSNFCRHRGHELAPVGDAFAARFIKCPYHAWTYGLDGGLRAAPSFWGRSGFDPSRYPLLPVPWDEWAGWLFLNISGSAAPLSTQIGNLDELLAPYRTVELVTAHRRVYDIRANWKIVIENYNECYHCTSIHPALCEVTPVDSGSDVTPTGIWCGGTMDLKDHAVTMSLDGASPVDPLPGVDGDRLRQVFYVTLFPNLLVSAHPDYVMTHRLEPLAVDRTRVHCSWLFAGDAVRRDGFDPSFAVDFWDLTNREDWAACEAVQRGVGAPGFRPGPLGPWEATVYQFLTMVARAYAGEPLSPSPVVDRQTTP